MVEITIILSNSEEGKESLMFETLKIRINKKGKAAATATAGEQLELVKKEPENTMNPFESQAVNMQPLPRVSWFVRVLQFIQSTLGLVGGVEAVWNLVKVFTQEEEEEKFEILVVKRA